MKKYVLSLCLLSNAVLMASHSCATQSSYSKNPLDKLHQFNMGLSASIKNFKYQEDSEGKKFMSESGNIPGLSLTMDGAVNDKFYLYGEMNYHAGKGKYDGCIQHILTNQKEPYRTSTRRSLLQTNWKAGYIIPVSSTSELVPYISAGTREYKLKWPSNAAKNLPKDTRTTRNVNYALGLIYNFALNNNLIISPELAIGKTGSGKVSYASHLCSTSDCYSYTLRNGIYYSATLKTTYLINSSLSTNMLLSYSHYKFGTSKNIRHGIIITSNEYIAVAAHEPKSFNSELTASVGLIMSL